jgi:hypothetical protein
MTATSNPAAIAMIEKMIASHEADIRLTEETLDVQLDELDRRVTDIRKNLARGMNIDSGWVRESAHKVEEAISKRRNLHASVVTLRDVVLPAAGGGE